MGSLPRLPFPGHKPASNFSNSNDVVRSAPDFISKYKMSSISALTPQDFTKRVSNFVIQNPIDWEEFILQNTRLNTLKEWVTKKKSLLQEEENVKNSCSNVKPPPIDVNFLANIKQLRNQVSNVVTYITVNFL